jgi:release factor glutamine methyltransferase
MMKSSKEMWTIGTILKWTGQYFRDKGVDNPRLDAEVLLSHILSKDRVYLYVHFDQPLEEGELAAYREMVKKRAARMPVAYILGSKEFMGLSFVVNPAVLIPRPDTEILVEAAICCLQEVKRPRILDLGTGSGAIIISMLSCLPEAAGVSVDLSPEALQIAATNAQKHDVAERLSLLQGDLFTPLHEQQFDMIVSNPPYIPDRDIDGLEPEVRKEPRLALAGGGDGLDFYRRIIAGAWQYLKADAYLALEVGNGQAHKVADLANEGEKYELGEIIKDYGGIERVVLLKKHLNDGSR